jgi:murein DD-endopeptidase MepM/ murein hydrolase activator NlpD
LAKFFAFVLGCVAGAAGAWLWSRGSSSSEPAAPVVQLQPAPAASPITGTTPPPLLAVSPAALPSTELPPLEPSPSPSSAASALPSPAPSVAGSPASEPPVLVSDLERLRQRGLLPPIAGLNVRSIRDTFEEMHGGHKHEAIDILSPRGTPVVAVDDGPVSKLFTSKQGGLTVYQFDPEGGYCYYYAHLDRYAEGLGEGTQLQRGDRVGYVGTTGNAPPNTPHLHFTIFRLGPEKRWWEGVAVNPYPLWAPAPR